MTFTATTGTPRRTGPLAFATTVFAFTVVMMGTTLPTPLYAVYAEHMGFDVLTTTTTFAALMVLGAALCGIGHGLSFSKGVTTLLGSVSDTRRADVVSAYFTVAYLATSIPVIGQGLAADVWGCTWQPRPRTPPSSWSRP